MKRLILSVAATAILAGCADPVYETNVFSSYGSCFDTDLEHLINLDWELLYTRRAVSEHGYAVYEYTMKREKKHREGDHASITVLNLRMLTRNIKMYSGEGNCDEPWVDRP